MNPYQSNNREHPPAVPLPPEGTPEGVHGDPNRFAMDRGRDALMRTQAFDRLYRQTLLYGPRAQEGLSGVLPSDPHSMAMQLPGGRGMGAYWMEYGMYRRSPLVTRHPLARGPSAFSRFTRWPGFPRWYHPGRYPVRPPFGLRGLRFMPGPMPPLFRRPMLPYPPLHIRAAMFRTRRMPWLMPLGGRSPQVDLLAMEQMRPRRSNVVPYLPAGMPPARNAVPSLRKQFAGAALGMIGAVALYTAYEHIAPLAANMLPESEAQEEVSERYERIGGRARAIMERMEAQRVH